MGLGPRRAHQLPDRLGHKGLHGPSARRRGPPRRGRALPAARLPDPPGRDPPVGAVDHTGRSRYSLLGLAAPAARPAAPSTAKPLKPLRGVHDERPCRGWGVRVHRWRAVRAVAPPRPACLGTANDVRSRRHDDGQPALPQGGGSRKRTNSSPRWHVRCKQHLRLPPTPRPRLHCHASQAHGSISPILNVVSSAGRSTTYPLTTNTAVQ